MTDPTTAFVAALQRQDLWHTRHARSPAGSATASAILASLRVSGYTLVSDAELEWLRKDIAALKMAVVYPDGRPAPNGYVGGWNDALDEALTRMAAALTTPESSNAK